MRLARPRFTVLRLMAAVAAVAVGLGGWIEWARLARLSARYEARAEELRIATARRWSRGQKSHEQWVDEARQVAAWNRKSTGFLWGISPPPEVCRAMAAYNRQLEAKYRRAAIFPWLPVEPDPPTPDARWAWPLDTDADDPGSTPR